MKISVKPHGDGEWAQVSVEIGEGELLRLMNDIVKYGKIYFDVSIKEFVDAQRKRKTSKDDGSSRA